MIEPAINAASAMSRLAHGLLKYTRAAASQPKTPSPHSIMFK
jgi:hypothetical protein